MSSFTKRRVIGKHKLNKVQKTSESISEPEAVHVIDQPWTPAVYTSFKLLMSARLCAAVWNGISDCDETYNYWEPMHYVLFGSGFQTWEYSPVYAIRSYAYLWLHAFPLKLYSLIALPNKIVLFYLMRCVLAFFSAVCEVYFYKGVCKQFGANTGRITLAFLLFSTGMFISSAAFLPSSFSMYLTMVAMGAWFLNTPNISILAIAASAIIGWPFAAALGIPIAYDVCIRKRNPLYLLKWSAIALVAFLIPLVQLDTYYYGKLVIAPLNIVWYNVFSDHGPDIYGVAPVSYYLVNGFLNFNFIFVCALVCLPFTLLLQQMLKLTAKNIPVWLSITPMYIWIAIFFTRPHKEERFLFPVYPFFALCGAVTIDYIQKLYSYMFHRHTAYHYTERTNWMSISIAILFSVFSVSRIIALYQGYHAPQDLYLELNRISHDPKLHTLSHDRLVNVCIGKEWYRFSSNFFMPNQNWHLQFIKSDFKGQLPKPYDSGPDATRIIPNHMNDLNQEETTRYINITRCHYLIDLDLENYTPLEPQYSRDTENWTILASFKYLDAQRSHRVFRAFYIPFYSHKRCTFVDYNLLKTTRTKRSNNKKKSEPL